jgi:hypothetical protein
LEPELLVDLQVGMGFSYDVYADVCVVYAAYDDGYGDGYENVGDNFDLVDRPQQNLKVRKLHP